MNHTHYKHTQIGYLMIYVIISLILLFGIMLNQNDFEPIPMTIMIGILLIMISFTSLKVTIDSHYLRIKFGYGLFRKKFALNKILSIKTTKNHWYHGWGIRVWFWPYRWLYNVSGFDAVEIKMKNGKIFRIGTDEPQNLEQTLNQTLKKVKTKNHFAE